jgi:hypothetical protein
MAFPTPLPFTQSRALGLRLLPGFAEEVAEVARELAKHLPHKLPELCALFKVLPQRLVELLRGGVRNPDL